jgi:hypothetical protein
MSDMKSSAANVLACLFAVLLLAAGCSASDDGVSDAALETATTAVADVEPTPAAEVPTTEPVTPAPATEPISEPDVEVDAEPASEQPSADEPDPTDDAASDGASSDPEASTPTAVPATTAESVAVANADYLGDYTYIDDGFGTIVTVAVDGATRTIASNALPNHDTGEFPNAGNPNTISEQDKTWSYTTTPTYVGTPSFAREPGVALNGVKFEPDTAERVNCVTGEEYRIEALQDTFDLGLDFNNAHVQPTGEYHYHGVSGLLVEAYASDEDLVLVGFAADGFMMYYSKSSAYDSSYTLATEPRTGTDCTYRNNTVDVDATTPDGTYASDWLYVDGLGTLDECNGIFIDGTYAYLVTEEYPFIPRCLMGEYSGAGGPGGAAPGGGTPGAGQGTAGQGAAGQAGPGGGAPPDLDNAASLLGIDRSELEAALGTPPPDLAAAAEALGITEAELQAALFG